MMAQSMPRVSPFEATLPGVGAQRLDRRYPLRAWVEVIPLDGRHEQVRGTTDDICHRGVFVRGELDLELGSLVVLKIYTRHGKLKMTARVVHKIEGIGCGCEFVDLNREQRHRVSILIALSSMAKC